MIFDLGTGTGRLSIASAFFKPKYIISIDIDWYAIKLLKKNITSLKLEYIIFPICSDIYYFNINRKFLPRNLKITTIMNPPFGVQKKQADRIFLQKAFLYSDVIYSIHLANKKVHNFILNYITKFNWKIDYFIPFKLNLEKTFQFHTQKMKKIDVTIYRFIKK